MNMNQNAIRHIKFSSLNLDDNFFSSLKKDYPDFIRWFKRKTLSGESAYVLIDHEKIKGFLYLKEESDVDNTIVPSFSLKRRLKIGSFKIDAHGTIVGHRFLSIIFQKMLNEEYSEAYATLFEKQQALVDLFEKFGFIRYGEKQNGELVYLKSLKSQKNIYKDFPLINPYGKKWLLAIWPKYHTKIFPDSQLTTEKQHIIEDLSVTNTIEKIYMCSMPTVLYMAPGDLIVIYRTKDGNATSGEYSSVATSICTVVEIKTVNQFNTEKEFMNYCEKGSIFSDKELKDFYESKRYPNIIKLLYNFPLKKRIIRKKLISDVELPRNAYWGCLEIDSFQFNKILEIGEINENFVVHKT